VPLEANVSPGTGWSQNRIGDASFWWAGHAEDARGFAEALIAGRPVPETSGLFAGVVATPGRVHAFVDHARSIPVFYADHPTPSIAAHPRTLGPAAASEHWDADTVLETAMSGFVAGPQTLAGSVYQVEPGQIVSWEAGRGPSAQRHFVYDSRDTAGSGATGEDALLSVIGAAFDRVIEQAGDGQVWVPLSGGLDSRLVLAALKARGCGNLRAFSYGPKGNADAVIARAVAERLDVPWQFVATSAQGVYAFFHGQVRRDYWTHADGLCATPNNQDLLPLMMLREKGQLDDTAMVVNGQTGDFISGGHIPDRLFRDGVTVGQLLIAIVERHYALWRSLVEPENIRTIGDRIRDRLSINEPDHETLSREHAIALWERVEYEGRQSHYIINGQRSYEFLGLRWALPLWDGDLVRFWRSATPEQKHKQRLYRETLKAWDHAGVFSMPTRTVTAWSRPIAAFLIPASNAARILAGRKRRDRWMTYARYLDRFGTHYQAFGWRHFARYAADARNPHAYYTRAWLEEIGAPWPGTDGPEVSQP
jgi:asparagine synthase (glutamine-hydrolysing)